MYAIKFVLATLGLAAWTNLISAEEILAYSLREAQVRIAEGSADDLVFKLGGLTRFVGMVFDAESSDVILIGRARKALPIVTLDDLVVALKSQLVHHRFPLVSIDITKATAENGLQSVRLEGGIEDTQFGADFIRADLFLKRYSLDLASELRGLPTYLHLYEAAIIREMQSQSQTSVKATWISEKESKAVLDSYIGRTSGESHSAQSRFWFQVIEDESYVVEKDGVFVIEELRLGVEDETHRPDLSKKKTDNEVDDTARVAEHFANQFTLAYARAGATHSEIGRLKSLFDLVAIARSISHLGVEDTLLSHLLTDYAVRVVETPRNIPLIERLGIFETLGRKDPVLIKLSGGIELEVVLLALEDGDTSALRDAVLISRSHAKALTWVVPVGAWEMPNDHKTATETLRSESRPPASFSGDYGFSLAVQFAELGGGTGKFAGFPPSPTLSPIQVFKPRFHNLERMLTRDERSSGTVGGVTMPFDVQEGDKVDFGNLFREIDDER